LVLNYTRSLHDDIRFDDIMDCFHDRRFNCFWFAFFVSFFGGLISSRLALDVTRNSRLHNSYFQKHKNDIKHS